MSERIDELSIKASAALKAAKDAWFLYAAECNLGSERDLAFDIAENIAQKTLYVSSVRVLGAAPPETEHTFTEMDVKKVSSAMVDLVTHSPDLAENHPECGKLHLLDMCMQVNNGEITGTKAHRWIGWIQGCVVMGGGATLKELKELNFSC